MMAELPAFSAVGSAASLMPSEGKTERMSLMYVTIFFTVRIQPTESYHSKTIPQILLTKLLPQF